MLTTEGLATFDSTAAGHITDDGQPGVVAIVAHREQEHAVVRGAMAHGGAPMRRDTLFRISSTTKPITAVATMALVAEGLIDLDEPVDRLLPELANPRVLRRIDGPLDDTVPADRAITARDLLTFTFGFGMAVEMFGGEPSPLFAAAAAPPLCTFGPPQPEKQAAPDIWIAALGDLPLVAQPGERWLYNTGAEVLGVLLARAAEVSFDEVLRTRVFGPLDMHDTAMWTSETDRLPAAYQADGTTLFDQPDGAWTRPPAFPDGAGGLLSSADDLVKLGRMFLRGGEPILSREAVADMTTNHITPDQAGSAADVFLDGGGWGYCVAVVTEGRRSGAFGWAGGLGTTWLVDPERELVIAVLTQRALDTPESFQIHADLQDAAYAAVG
jgi:CubicO group peptidase (beta-lactamase class C family)